jgi:hypothetical protein
MASHIEMKRLAEDLDAVRATARHILSLTDVDWSDWETDFLEHMAAYDGDEPLSMRQREKLTDLRDRAELVRDWHGIPVARLVDACNVARLDLSEADEEFIATLARRSSASLRRGQLFRLCRIAARLGVIEPHIIAVEPNRRTSAEAA